MQTAKNDIGPDKILNVIDTSAFITYPRLISHIEGQVLVPLTVIKQLDGLKNNSDSVICKRARQASLFIERAIAEKKVAILTAYDRIDALDSESDNRIVGAAVRLKNNHPDAKVVLIATDRNMRISASAYGIAALNVRENTARKNYVWDLSLSIWFGVFAAVVVAGVVFLGVGLSDITSWVILLGAAASILLYLYFIYSTLRRNHNADLSVLAGRRNKFNFEQSIVEKNIRAVGSGDANDWVHF